MSLRVRGASLAWDSGGATSVPPLVWGHGLTSSRADEDAFPLVDLARVRSEATVVRYDAHGHGASSVLTEPERGSWAELARDQIELIEYLGIDEVVLGGASMGTGTALHAALRLGERVRGLILVIPPTGWDERAAQISVYEQMARIAETHGTEPLVRGLQATPPPDPLVDLPEWRTMRAERLRSADVERLAANFRGAGHADLPTLEALATLDVPTLILAWTGDAVHPTSTAERLAATMPTTDLVIARTRGEFATWTERVLAFLRPMLR